MTETAQSPAGPDAVPVAGPAADGATPPTEQPLKVALLGCGVVGSEVARMLVDSADDFTARIGRPLELVGIGVRRAGVERPGIDSALFTTDTEALVRRGDVDLVIEVIGGIEPAKSLILTAMDHGASVVTANKALLAEAGTDLFSAAEAAGVDLYFEAAVAGAIPIIRPLRESLVGDEITAVMGIVNGTTNFILDKMHGQGTGYADALAEAQALGYAEADPTADVEGFDAAAKAAILAGLAFHSRVRGVEVHREGITEITRSDIASAKAMGCVVKLLAICELSGEGAEATINARVHPAMIPEDHPLASVGGAYNAVFVESKAAGRLMFYGPGAGGSPTASAVLGDLVTVARNRTRHTRGPGESTYAQRPVHSIGEVVTRYHLSLEVDDRAGVLAAIAQCFAEHEVSVQTLRQVASPGEDGEARLVVVTHPAKDAALAACVRALDELPAVHEVLSVMRVEGM
ncbi:homoserine dehydrogenase [Naumannella halotolerans]|uniref:homoserine dehydrogenase n=1 Tax=Naumannella halotolerans TaxID=993414 RepID=UPI00370D5914